MTGYITVDGTGAVTTSYSGLADGAPDGAIQIADALFATLPRDIGGWKYQAANGGAFIAPVAPAPTLAQQAQALLAGGLTVTSTGNSALDATYACDDTTQQHIQAEMIAIGFNHAFADGTQSVDWPDVSGKVHTFDVAQFSAFGTAIAAFVAGALKVAMLNSGTLPAATTTIP